MKHDFFRIKTDCQEIKNILEQRGKIKTNFQNFYE